MFSYAFLISNFDSNTGDPVWVFFVNIPGKETGMRVNEVEDLISLKNKNVKTIKRRYHDHRFEELDKFLLNHTDGFGTKGVDDSSPNLHTPSRYSFGKVFENAYSNFLDRYDSEDYPQAMRDFRALIQDALEITCNNMSIPIPSNIEKDMDITKFVGELIKQKSLDGRLQPWSQAFTSISNESRALLS